MSVAGNKKLTFASGSRGDPMGDDQTRRAVFYFLNPIFFRAFSDDMPTCLTCNMRNSNSLDYDSRKFLQILYSCVNSYASVRNRQNLLRSVPPSH